jgi:hypothetical protein
VKETESTNIVIGTEPLRGRLGLSRFTPSKEQRLDHWPQHGIGQEFRETIRNTLFYRQFTK